MTTCACRLEHRSLQEELEALKVGASGTQLELREKLAQAVTEITLLHHTLRGVTDELLAALSDEVTKQHVKPNYLGPVRDAVEHWFKSPQGST